jgi:hypothetical protein
MGFATGVIDIDWIDRGSKRGVEEAFALESRPRLDERLESRLDDRPEPNILSCFDDTLESLLPRDVPLSKDSDDDAGLVAEDSLSDADVSPASARIRSSIISCVHGGVTCIIPKLMRMKKSEMRI